ncbi:MAG: hypothetical protein GF364_10140 [Candidatus Lokiarchaeota archaeon]|nr:hypothetical protein [Candidatus Lokiarchaeota archaeon]
MSKKRALVLKSMIFTFLIPGTVIAIIPIIIYMFMNISIEIHIFRYIGIPFLILGVSFYVSSVYIFITQGGGTPMIYLAEKTERLFGKEPKTLVISKIYKRSRNPMYFGVILMIFGEGLLVESFSILIWGILTFIAFHITIIKKEEPHLEQKYGDSYRKYRERVPRWFRWFGKKVD